MSIRVGTLTLGCPKNEVDTELMQGYLKKAGHDLTSDLNAADVIIVNTCCFITKAKEESIASILEVAGLKQEDNRPLVLVAGCLGERYGREILEEMPEVDGVIGTNEIADVAAILSRLLTGERVLAVGNPPFLCSDHRLRVRLNASPVAYVKIAEGCDNYCSYCIIPYIRGPYRSRPMEDIVGEAEQLSLAGTKEIILVAQETTRYGIDLYGRFKLADLLKQLVKVDGIEWIRVMYGYPTNITRDLIEIIAREEKICKYVDLPLQHVSDRILKRMNRRGCKEKILELINELRASIPGLTLRTTFLVGFPGETEEEFQELLAFMDEVKFERAGVFAYSREEGTAAASMPGQVPEQIKQARVHEAMMLQRDISYYNNRARVGRVEKVLVEGFDSSRQACAGRAQSDAPEVDGQVFFTAPRCPKPGRFVYVRVTEAEEYDLSGELTDEPAE